MGERPPVAPDGKREFNGRRDCAWPRRALIGGERGEGADSAAGGTAVSPRPRRARLRYRVRAERESQTPKEPLNSLFFLRTSASPSPSRTTCSLQQSLLLFPPFLFLFFLVSFVLCFSSPSSTVHRASSPPKWLLLPDISGGPFLAIRPPWIPCDP